MSAIQERAPRVTAHALAVVAQSNVLENPYLAAMHDGSMDLDGFRRTQEQFFFAVTFFPRPMAALVGRIPHPRLRLDILHNLIEEHGEFNEAAFHHTTFQEFLRRLGCDPANLDEHALWPELRAFNSVLTSACVMDELEVGIACMGIIELAFAGISAVIGGGIVARGWLPAERMIHYKLHAEIDERHAEEFFAVVEQQWDDPKRRYFIIQGLELGMHVFDRLFRELHQRSLASVRQ